MAKFLLALIALALVALIGAFVFAAFTLWAGSVGGIFYCFRNESHLRNLVRDRMRLRSASEEMTAPA
jgi:hypothetical protein